MKIREPIGDWIVARDIDHETQLASKLVLPDSKSGNVRLAVVKHVGKGRRLMSEGCAHLLPMRVQPGDHVLYNKEMAEPILLNGEPTVLFQEGAVSVIVDVD